MWELNHKEGWARRIDTFKLFSCRRLLSLLDCKEIKLVNPKGNQPWILEGLMLKLKLQYFGPPDVKSQLIGKDPDAEKVWRQKEKGMADDEMVR